MNIGRFELSLDFGNPRPRTAALQFPGDFSLEVREKYQ